MNISELDHNFAVEAKTGEETVFYNCLEEPFRVYGLLHAPDGFRRLPAGVAGATNPGVLSLSEHTAGGRVRFRTDSPKVSIRVKERRIGKMPHIPLTGSAGLDLYADGSYLATFVPPYDLSEGFESEADLPDRREREILIHFPLYAGVTELEIGLAPGSTLRRARDYRIEKPVLFYGSSITQGGCASRPGACYTNVLSRRFDCDTVNLGFSGSARGETAIAEYIAAQEMSVFVYDYDHNAPTPEHLEKTHARMFELFRAKQPKTPVIMMTMPFSLSSWPRRTEIIRATYDRARAAGDRNIYFVDTRAYIMEHGGWDGTVDRCHPNDLGFFDMANAVAAVLEKLI